jgi:hypothetical protein
LSFRDAGNVAFFRISFFGWAEYKFLQKLTTPTYKVITYNVNYFKQPRRYRDHDGLCEATKRLLYVWEPKCNNSTRVFYTYHSECDFPRFLHLSCQRRENSFKLFLKECTYTGIYTPVESMPTAVKFHTASYVYSPKAFHVICLSLNSGHIVYDTRSWAKVSTYSRKDTCISYINDPIIHNLDSVILPRCSHYRIFY